MGNSLPAHDQLTLNTRGYQYAKPMMAGNPRMPHLALPQLTGEKLSIINRNIFPNSPREDLNSRSKDSGLMLNSPSRFLQSQFLSSNTTRHDGF